MARNASSPYINYYGPWQMSNVMSGSVITFEYAEVVFLNPKKKRLFPLTFSTLHTKTYTYANSVDPDETARNEFTLFAFPFLLQTEIPFCVSGQV